MSLKVKKTTTKKCNKIENQNGTHFIGENELAKLMVFWFVVLEI